ncbi:Crp/Fnr family transcriptional regulator [Desulfofalx alkaliphila]|uniref:Crp/Fnr family transcriptional regulator n=1 Tax=Desulfofalx alkaliphila TaxID=105483 RepID=UPI0004E14429|nr:Crp/Fnr family transcriptional regulator [Desulfofalx alkaliphila]
MDLIKQPGVVLCKFKKGDYIIRQGEEIQYLYYLEKGSCRRSTITEKGDEIVFGIKDSSKEFVQRVLGVLILYSDGVSVSNFIAEEDCRCYRIPKDTFTEYVQDKPDILNSLVSLAMYELRELKKSFQARQEGKVANRLCELLLNNAYHKNGKLIVNKKYSLTKISQFLGIHRVTVAKILKSLRDEGVITREKEGIVILDEKQLENYANAEKIIDYK